MIEFPSISVNIFGLSDDPTWASVEPGDGLVWDTGAFYIVKEVALDDGRDITFILMCVVSAEHSPHEHGTMCQWQASKHNRLPAFIRCVKPTRES